MHTLDIVIIVLYMLLMIAVGWVVMKLAARSSESYFLAGKSLPWWLIGVAHGSSGIDITGTMWFVMMLYVYGLKAVWLLWVWPLFNVLFRMVYLGVWVRRSNVLTGAEWMRTRFGYGVGAELGYLSVVLYALVSVVGFLSYAFRGIGDFVVPYMPFASTFTFELFGRNYEVLASNVYATVILLITGLYCVVGGMYSVVLNDLIQFTLICVAAVVIAAVAMSQTTGEQIADAVPAGWDVLWPSWRDRLRLGGEGLPLSGSSGSTIRRVARRRRLQPVRVLRRHAVPQRRGGEHGRARRRTTPSSTSSRRAARARPRWKTW